MSLTPEEIVELDAKIEEAAEKAAQKATPTPEELKTIVAEAVRQTLLQMGVDSSNPIEMQRDFNHLRQWRRAGDEIKKKGIVATISIFATGVLALVLIGVKEWLNS